MDRRYICSSCGMKWFIQAADAARPDLTRCGACNGELRRLESPEPAR